MLAQVDRYLTTQIYEWAFKPNFSDDEMKDLELQKRIRSLHWITGDVLDAEIDEENLTQKSHLEDAITGIDRKYIILSPENITCPSHIFTVQGSSPKLILSVRTSGKIGVHCCGRKPSSYRPNF